VESEEWRAKSGERKNELVFINSDLLTFPLSQKANHDVPVIYKPV
jgi:hypothetical protein